MSNDGSVDKLVLTFGSDLNLVLSHVEHFPHPDDAELAEALAVARSAGVKVVSRIDRNNPLYFDRRTHQPVGGIELNRRIARL